MQPGSPAASSRIRAAIYRLFKKLQALGVSSDQFILIVTIGLTLVWSLCVGTYVFNNFSAITKLEPNALGDFLAGTCSPLAFLWLTAAVLLQRCELGYQRNELLLSRQAIDRQTEEFGKSVQQLQRQADLLNEQEIDRKKASAVGRMDMAISQYREEILRTTRRFPFPPTQSHATSHRDGALVGLFGSEAELSHISQSTFSEHVEALIERFSGLTSSPGTQTKYNVEVPKEFGAPLAACCRDVQRLLLAMCDLTAEMHKLDAARYPTERMRRIAELLEALAELVNAAPSDRPLRRI